MGVVMCPQPEKTTSGFDEWRSDQVNSVYIVLLEFTC